MSIDKEFQDFGHLKVFHSMALGYALHRMIYNENGEAVDYEFLDINDAFTQMTGLTREYALGKTVKQILPSIEEYWIKKFGRVATTGEPDNFENYSIALGKKFKVSAFCPQKGYFGVLFDDTTPIEQLHHKILEAEDKYQRLFSLSNDGILVINREGFIHEVNERFCSFLETSRPLLTGKSLYEFISHDTKENLQQQLSQLFEKGILHSELEILSTQGKKLVFEVLASVYDTRANLALCNLRDISFRKKTEKALTAYHKRMQAIYNQDALGILELKEDFTIISCNPQFKKLIGSEDNDPIGKSLSDFVIPEEKAFLHPILSLLQHSNQSYSTYLHLRTATDKSRAIKLEIGIVDDVENQTRFYIGFVIDISNLRDVEQRLIAQKNFHESILDNLSELLVRWKPDGTILFANKAYHDFYRLTNTDNTVANIFDYVPLEEKIRIQEHIQQLSTEKSVILDKHLSKGKNEPRWHLWSDRGIFDAEGNLVEIISIGLDIDELEKSLTQAQIQQTFFEELFNSSPFALVFLDDNQRVIRINKAFTQLFGYTPEECIGRPISDLIIPEDKEEERQQILKDVFVGRQIFVETLRKKKDGSRIFVRLTGSMVKLHEKLLGIFGIYEDITLQKKYKEHLENHTRLIELILSITQSPSMDYKNMLKKTVYEAMQLLGGDFGLFFEYNPLNMEVTIHAYSEEWEERCSTIENLVSLLNEPGNQIISTLSANQPIIFNNNSEDSLLKAICPGKDVKSMLIIPISSEGHCSGALILGSLQEHKYENHHLSEGSLLVDSVWRAVEQQRLVRELRKALTKAEESERLKSSFLAAMSHELRTPLNAIIGFSSLIDESMTLEEIIDCVRTIQASGNHLLNLINDMFHLSAFEAGQLSPNKELINLERLFSDIKDFIHSYQQIENKQHIDVRFHPDPMAVNVKLIADQQKLTEVLISLVKNSLKFTEEGYIEYGYLADKEKVTFFVRDTGIGIPKEKHEIIFEKFRQGDESSTRKYGGAGIGLTLVKALTEIMGGRVYFESEVGEGSIFFVELPCQMEIIEERSTEIEYTILSGAEIMIVEDEETNYRLIESMLKKYKPVLVHFYDGENAVEYIEKGGQPQVILMDIRLPGIDGLETTRRIKALKPNIPIIAQTAYAMTGDYERCKSAGCDDYLTKPFRRQQLINILINWLK